MTRRLLTVVLLGALAGTTNATTTFSYAANGIAGGSAVNAQADFALDNGLLTLTLTNLVIDPSSVGQNVSGFAFSLSTLGVDVTGGSLTSSSGLERTVSTNGSYIDGSMVPAGWNFTPGTSGNGGVYTLNVLGSAAGPAHTLLGLPGSGGTYASANSSIRGNGPHNPFLAGPLVFVFSIPGLTEGNTAVDFAQFSFGTTPGVALTAAQVPEPVTMAMVGCGLIAVFFIRRKKARR